MGPVAAPVEAPAEAPAAPVADAPEGSASSSGQVALAPPAAAKVHSRFIQPGDLVIVFVSRDKTPVPLKVVPGEEMINAWGAFEHNEMIGRPFGCRLYSRGRKGFVYLLRPSPELWTLALPHRTQILYQPDMSFITLQLGIGPGSRIIEAGTGSGSFTHFLARTVGRAHQWHGGRGWKGDGYELEGRDSRDGGAGRAAGKKRKLDDDEAVETKEEPVPREPVGTEPDPHVEPNDGRVWSFEFNQVRVEKARSEFEAHGLTRTVSLRHRNVCKDGFGLQGAANAVFLDVPAPWEALAAAAESLRPDIVGRICCFSPCIEQVLRTAQGLWDGGWSDVETYESLVRTHESLAHPRSAPLPSIDTAIERIKSVEQHKNVRRSIQIDRAKQARLNKAEQEKKEAEEAQGEGAAQPEEAPVPTLEAETAEGVAKAIEEEAQQEAADFEMEEANGSAELPTPSPEPWVFMGDSRSGNNWKERKLEPANVYSRPYPEMRGHTSYLTFATLRPRVVQSPAHAAAPKMETRATAAAAAPAPVEAALAEQPAPAA